MRKINRDIEKVKNDVLALKGLEVNVKINPGRNKISFKRVLVENVYSSLFTLKSLDNGTEKIESYSFSDVLCGRVCFI